jgi:hypothetical protein
MAPSVCRGVDAVAQNDFGEIVEAFIEAAVVRVSWGHDVCGVISGEPSGPAAGVPGVVLART